MIVVTAPTSHIGSDLLTELIGRTELRVVARDPDRLPAEVRDHASVLSGSHADAATIARALDGADSVFWLVPTDPQAPDVVAFYREFAAPFCDAIIGNGVRRVVYVTTLGSGYPHHAGHLSAALLMDDMIHATGVDYRALRMPFFMENLIGQADPINNDGVFYLPNNPDRTLLTVATRDIAAAAAASLLDDAWTGQNSVPVISPDNLSPNEMAKVISTVIDRHVRVQHVAPDDYRKIMEGHGMTPGIAQGMVDMAAAQDDGIYDADAAGASRSDTSFERWCRDTLRPALDA